MTSMVNRFGCTLVIARFRQLLNESGLPPKAVIFPSITMLGPNEPLRRKMPSLMALPSRSSNLNVKTTRLAGFCETFLKLMHARNVDELLLSTKTDDWVMKIWEFFVVCLDGTVTKSAPAAAVVEITNARQASTRARRIRT